MKSFRQLPFQKWKPGFKLHDDPRIDERLRIILLVGLKLAFSNYLMQLRILRSDDSITDDQFKMVRKYLSDLFIDAINAFYEADLPVEKKLDTLSEFSKYHLLASIEFDRKEVLIIINKINF